MKTLEEIRQAIIEETDRIWLKEPEEIKRLRLGVSSIGAGSYGQYFSNMVFTNGDLRALATWVTPGMVLRSIDDPSFTLDHCQKIFKWVNMVNVDFLAYSGLIILGGFAHDIVEAYPLMKSKEDFKEVLKAWYAYANRMYFWVHHVFPWGLGEAFSRPTKEDIAFIDKGLKDESVQEYFKKYADVLVSSD